MTRSRYPGTQPFGDSADDYARFFGRAEESEQLYLRVLSVPLLVQFGKSGLGKTSLLQAGLFPRLRSKTFLPIMIRLNDTADSLTAAVARSLKQSCQSEGIEYTERPAAGLWELLSATLWRDDLLLTPVLVFDQFEEVFTLRDAAFRAEIATELGALASGIAPARLQTAGSRPSVKIVISLREDYLGALEEFSTSIPGLFQERLRLEPFTEKEARQSIVGPAQLVPAAGEEPYWSPPFTFDAAALAAMVDYLKGASGAIEPFQLQLLCRNAATIAHEKSVAGQEPVQLTLADFKGSRDFASVLENFYRDTLHKITPPSQRKRAQILAEEGLLGAAGHRLMLEEGQILSDYGLSKETLTILTTERLVRREKRLDSVFYEISHDRLSESIYKSRRNKLPRKWRRAIWAAALSALVILGGLAFFSYRVRAARNRAEGLLGFLLGEQFLGDVRDVGRSSLLELVQNKVENPKEQGSRVEFNHGLELRNRGDVHRSKGQLKRSVESFQQALQVFDENPGEIESLREAARTHDRLGWAYYDEGEVTKSLQHYDAAVDAWRKVVAHPEQPEMLLDDCTNLADSLVAAGDVNGRMGRATSALEHVEEALSVASNILFGAHGPHTQCAGIPGRAEPYPDAKVLQVLSRAAMSRATVLNFHEDYEGAAILATQARWLQPLSVAARQNERLALLYRASDIGNEQRSLDDCRAALEDFEELRRWDPTNPQWLHERAGARVLVTISILACRSPGGSGCNPMPSLQVAEATSLDALATLRGLGTTDPDNRTWAGARAWALEANAAVLKELGRNQERLARIEEAEGIYSGGDDADTERVQQLGRVLGQKADALMALKRVSEAKAALQRAIDLFETLVAAHPDNPTYAYSLLAARQGNVSTFRSVRAGTEAVVADPQVERLKARYDQLTGSVAKRAEMLYGKDAERLEAGQRSFEKGDLDGAMRALDEARDACFQSIALRPAESEAYSNLYAVNNRLADVQQRLGRTQEEGAALTAAMHAAQLAAWLAPEAAQPRSNTDLVTARSEMSKYLHRVRRLDESLMVIQELVSFAQSLADRPDKDANDEWLLGTARCSLGAVRREHKKAGWEETVRSGLVHLEIATAMPNGGNHWDTIGQWRKFLVDKLAEDGRKADAATETALALKAYQQAAALAPNDENVQKAIRELTGGTPPPIQ
jgi:tetratricopeptide (TPR) repeat protein